MNYLIFITSVILFIINVKVTLAENVTGTTAATTASNKNEEITRSNVNVSHVYNNETEIPDDDADWTFENKTEPDTRRILYGKRVPRGRRPYMVYLQLTADSAKASKYQGWLCGGVIVHPFYVLTSAACVEDADHFYVIHGTNTYVDTKNHRQNECVCKNRRRVVWKCIPKNYKFNFEDSLQWSANDIAIVKVHRRFRIGTVEAGCSHAARVIAFNNISRSLEQRNTKAMIAGWGTTGGFREGVYRRYDDSSVPANSRCLQEAKVCIMDKSQCARRWANRFRDIINTYMICTRDVVRRLSEVCEKKYANCTEINKNRRLQSPEDADSETWALDVGRHLRFPDSVAARRFSTGGFCENDHGGPLIVRHRNRDVVIGVISACKIDPRTHNCHGPFLYTSVYYNRQFLSCAIYKDVQQGCRRVFRTGITHEEYNVDWSGIKDELKFDERWKKRSEDDDDDEGDDMDDDRDDLRAGNDDKEKTNENDDKHDEVATEAPEKEPELRAGKNDQSGEGHKDDEVLTGSGVSLRAKEHIEGEKPLEKMDNEKVEKNSSKTKK